MDLEAWQASVLESARSVPQKDRHAVVEQAILRKRRSLFLQMATPSLLVMLVLLLLPSQYRSWKLLMLLLVLVSLSTLPALIVNRRLLRMERELREIVEQT